ncbi:hypothetical protein BJX64DRAFT_264708 [Aspergillus heterothallicus]
MAFATYQNPMEESIGLVEENAAEPHRRPALSCSIAAPSVSGKRRRDDVRVMIEGSSTDRSWKKRCMQGRTNAQHGELMALPSSAEEEQTSSSSSSTNEEDSYSDWEAYLDANRSSLRCDGLDDSDADPSMSPSMSFLRPQREGLESAAPLSTKPRLSIDTSLSLSDDRDGFSSSVSDTTSEADSIFSLRQQQSSQTNSPAPPLNAAGIVFAEGHTPTEFFLSYGPTDGPDILETFDFDEFLNGVGWLVEPAGI